VPLYAPARQIERRFTVYTVLIPIIIRSGFGVRDSKGHERRAHGGLALDIHTRNDVPQDDF